MPIRERPLLEYWLYILQENGIKKILVNLHHHASHVKEFLERPRFKGVINYTYERKLLGTAGTLKANKIFFQDCTTLLVHADNWCQCDFSDFLDFHTHRRPENCPITMMTFDSDMPQECGIVETDNNGVVVSFIEKPINPSGSLANAAVYLLEPDVINWIQNQQQIKDFSKDVIPEFIGRISTWHNKGIHRDIGVLKKLKKAQLDPIPVIKLSKEDLWQKNFNKNPIHKQILEIKD